MKVTSAAFRGLEARLGGASPLLMLRCGNIVLDLDLYARFHFLLLHDFLCLVPSCFVYVDVAAALSRLLVFVLSCDGVRGLCQRLERKFELFYFIFLQDKRVLHLQDLKLGLVFISVGLVLIVGLRGHVLVRWLVRVFVISKFQRALLLVLTR